MKSFKHIYSISGGQDSTAMTVRALELNHPVDYIIFCDTGNEFPEMYQYLANLNEWLLKKYNIGITRLSSGKTLETLCFSPFLRGKNKGKIRGFPYSSCISSCMSELKKNVANNFAKKVGGAYMYLGYVAREKNRVHEPKECYLLNKYPLIECEWNEDHVSNFLKQMGIYNHLYDYYTRTGCMFCSKQSLSSWRVLYTHFPQQFKIAQSWEHKAKELNAHIKTFRSDCSLDDLAFRFEGELQKEKNYNQIKFSFDWNEENASCFCKF